MALMSSDPLNDAYARYAAKQYGTPLPPAAPAVRKPLGLRISRVLLILSLIGMTLGITLTVLSHILT